jgi:hypothetical protein
MKYYLARQIVADRQAALAADLTHRALVKDALAARRASAASAARPARIRRLFAGRLLVGRLVHTGA